MFLDVLVSLLTRVMGMAAGLLTGILTARALGVSGRGEYFYVVTLATSVTQFGNLGLASANTYSLAQDPSLLSRLAAHSFWVSLAGGGVAGLLLLTLKIVGAATGSGTVWIVTLIVPTMMYRMLASHMLIGLGRIRHYNFLDLGASLLQLVSVVAAAHLGAGVRGFLAVSLGVGFTTSIAFAVVLWTMHSPTFRFDLPLFRTRLGYAGRAYLASVLPYAVSRAGVFLLEGLAGKTQVGIYSVAVQFGDSLVLLPATVSMVLFPNLLRGPPGDRFRETLRAVSRVAFAMIALCGATAIASAWIVPAWFGPAFAGAVHVLWWMLPGVLALSIASIFSQYLGTRGIPPASLGVWASGLGVLVAAGSYSVPHWGALGAAASLTTSYVFIAVALSILSVRHARHDSLDALRRHDATELPA